jgi:hypothetical protein
MRNFLTSTTESSGSERILLVLGQVCTNARRTHAFCNSMGTILYSSSLFSYHFCKKFNHKIFQQVYTFCVRILVIPKSKHHTSQFFGEESFTSWKSCAEGCLCLFLFKLLSEMSVWICIINMYTHNYKLLLFFYKCILYLLINFPTLWIGCV